eukprot:scaffold44201_cov19-Tisochrysis_lutea.AAC.2
MVPPKTTLKDPARSVNACVAHSQNRCKHTLRSQCLFGNELKASFLVGTRSAFNEGKNKRKGKTDQNWLCAFRNELRASLNRSNTVGVAYISDPRQASLGKQHVQFHLQSFQEFHCIISFFRSERFLLHINCGDLWILPGTIQMPGQSCLLGRLLAQSTRPSFYSSVCLCPFLGNLLVVEEEREPVEGPAENAQQQHLGDDGGLAARKTAEVEKVASSAAIKEVEGQKGGKGPGTLATCGNCGPGYPAEQACKRLLSYWEYIAEI